MSYKIKAVVATTGLQTNGDFFTHQSLIDLSAKNPDCFIEGDSLVKISEISEEDYQSIINSNRCEVSMKSLDKL